MVTADQATGSLSRHRWGKSTKSTKLADSAASIVYVLAANSPGSPGAPILKRVAAGNQGYRHVSYGEVGDRMARKKTRKVGAPNRQSRVSAAFVEHNYLIKAFLARFFSEQQDIEDVAQEAYLRAYVAEQGQRVQKPKAFLFRIAKNVALTQLTKKSTQITDYIEECGDLALEEDFAVDLEVEAQESLGLYCEAIAALPEKCRQVFLLRKVHGLAHREIAERMSLSISSVEKYLHQGLLESAEYLALNSGPAAHRSRDGSGRIGKQRNQGS